MTLFFPEFAQTDPTMTVLRLVAAALLGALVGMEREARHRSAGLRTHMLVSLAAAGFTLIAWNIFLQVFEMGVSADRNVTGDPVRIVEAVTAGVAFLAAGAIIRDHNRVLGLTTGAGMWLAGAVGTACGRGYFGIAIVMTLVTLIILAVVRRLEARWFRTENARRDSEADTTD